MPLKFLKKCRQYNVTSKNLFVISVHHLLDTTTTVDCTISSESKGQECLDNVCQRLLIQQPEFFGLRYVVKGKEDELKWIDLERSLSRQLEKYAAGTKIYLRVRHYVTTGVRHLSDEVTRYYHFLQLKNDIFEGRITCDIRTAILLALYCRQAEYDSYQSDKQGKDYLKKSLLLPKNLQGLANDDNLLDGLIADVLQQHPLIQHLSTSQAEEMYIQCCQQLEGYGEERFMARDNLGNELTLGLAINGMVVLAENGRQYFPWKDFHTVTIDKRTIRIEQNKTDGSLFVGSFIFPEADTARYFWKLCITQHKFFKRYIDEDSTPGSGSTGTDVENSNSLSITGVTLGTGNGNAGRNVVVEGISSTTGFSTYDVNDSREDLLLDQRAIYTPGIGGSGITTIGSSTALGASNSTLGISVNHPYIYQGLGQMQGQEYLSSTQSLHQQTGTNLMHNNNSSNLMSSNISLATSHQSSVGGGGGGGGGIGMGVNAASGLNINGSVLHLSHHAVSGNGVGPPHSQNWINKEYPQEFAVSSSQHLSGSILDTRLQSSSCQDLSNSANSTNILNGSSLLLQNGTNNYSNGNDLLLADVHERERLKAMLPTYRPAPDYETAIQLKYRTPTNEIHNINQLQYQATALMTPPSVGGGTAVTYYAGSQPDVHQTDGGSAGGLYHDSILLGHLHAAHRYPDVAQPAAALHAHHHYKAVAAVAAAGGINSSLPINNVYVDLSQRLQMIRSKPPPPYPANRLSSSSTPDLAVASHRPLVGYRAYVSGSSPDLVSNRNLFNTQYQYATGPQNGVGVGGVAGAGSGGITSKSTSSGATMLHHQYQYIGHMGQSQTYLPAPPHGTFENLNMIEEQPSIMSQLRQSVLNQDPSSTQTLNTNFNQNSPTLAPTLSANNISHRSTITTVPSTSVPIASNQVTSGGTLQRNPTISGSIEPIYENVPLPQLNNSKSEEHRSSESSTNNSETTAAMRNRTSSIQSAPGLMHVGHIAEMGNNYRFHQQQQHLPNNSHQLHSSHNTNFSQLQQQQSQMQSESDETSDEVLLNIKRFNTMAKERAASSEIQLQQESSIEDKQKQQAQIPLQRTVRAASATPNIGGSTEHTVKMTPPPRQHRALKDSLLKTNVKKNKDGNAIIMTTHTSTSPSPSTSSISIKQTSDKSEMALIHNESLISEQFSAINISNVSTFTYNSTSTHDDSESSQKLKTSITTPTSIKNNEKQTRKKRWNFLGRSKTPDKQKSATLGREKATTASKLNKVKLAQDDLNLHHRWSTGVPKLQPISGRFSKDKLSQILTDKLNDPQLFMEFEAIPKRRELAKYDCALLQENAVMNSEPNFLPYDDNRVRLTPTMDNRHGYVNASHISATVGSKQRFYIVAQSPYNDLTTRIFWQCVWEADVYLIVQLSDDTSYIPLNSNKRTEFGQFQVYQEFSQTTDRCVTSKLRLYHIQSRRYRSVWHLNYNDWIEQNCPSDVNHFLDFLEELNSVRMASINEIPPGHNTNPPVLLHCLEGGGRSGVTLTADLLLYTLDHNEDLDIPRVIGQLRHQRDSIIPSLAQYKHIYGILVTYLKRTRLI